MRIRHLLRIVGVGVDGVDVVDVGVVDSVSGVGVGDISNLPLISFFVDEMPNKKDFLNRKGFLKNKFDVDI